MTNGHLDVVQRAARLFDKVIVAIAENDAKQPLFTLEERRQLVGDAVQCWPNVETDSFTGLLIQYARRRRANAVIRGLRAVSDFEFEFQLALINRHMDETIETILRYAQGHVHLSEFSDREGNLPPRGRRERVRARDRPSRPPRQVRRRFEARRSAGRLEPRRLSQETRPRRGADPFALMSLMVHLAEVARQPVVLTGALSTAELAVADGADLTRLDRPVEYALTVQKLAAALLVEGWLQTDLACQCARCLKPFRRPLARSRVGRSCSRSRVRKRWLWSTMPWT